MVKYVSSNGDRNLFFLAQIYEPFDGPVIINAVSTDSVSEDSAIPTDLTLTPTPAPPGNIGDRCNSDFDCLSDLFCDSGMCAELFLPGGWSTQI